MASGQSSNRSDFDEAASPLLASEALDRLNCEADELFSHQYVLAPRGKTVFPGFDTTPLGGFDLHHSPAAFAAPLRDMNGAPIGVCLGVAVDADGMRVVDRRIPKLSYGSSDFWTDVENFVIGLAGRYVVFVEADGDLRIYGDPSSHYSCVFDRETGIAASTLLLCLQRPIEENPAIDYRTVTNGNAKFPFGHTRDRSVRSLAGNHFLRVADMTEHRFWPPAGELEEIPEDRQTEVVAEIADRLGAILKAIASTGRAALPLSGGNDSRTLIACAKPALGELGQVYTQHHNRVSRMDDVSAKAIAKKLGVAHDAYVASGDDAYPPETISAMEERFDVSTGYACAKPNIFGKKYDGPPRRGDIILSGNVLEIMRGAHWKAMDRTRAHNARFGLKRCLFVGGADFTADFIEQWLPHYRRWLKNLHPDGQRASFDLLFLEHNLPNLGRSYFGWRKEFFVCPFNDRRLLALTSRLPLAFRFSNSANRELLRQTAPELLDVPYARDLMAKRARSKND